MNITSAVLPDLYLLQPGKSYRGYMKSNVYLLNKTILIDSGPGGIRSPRRLLKALKALKVQRLDYLLLTHGHPDHTGGARLIKEAMGGKIAISREDASRLHSKEGVNGDVFLENGKKLYNGKVLCLNTPGHSQGHFCFYFPERSILFSGDIVPGWGTTVISPPEGDMHSYIKSLQGLNRLPLKLICPGHGPPIQEPQTKIEEIIKHRLERENQVLSCLKEGRNSIRATLQQIYPELGKKLRPLARRQILAHLLKLEKEGLARKTGRGWQAVGSR